MKQKSTTMTILMLVCSMHAIAQHVYFGLGTGYNYPAAPNIMAANNYNNENDKEHYERIKGSGSFGKGFTFQAMGGYTFKPNMSFELSAAYLMGSRINSSNKYSDEFAEYTNENSLESWMIRLIPALKFHAGDGKIRPYMRAGAVIGLGARLTVTDESQYTDFQNSWANENSVMVMEFKGRTSLGFSAALGADFKLGEKISLFGEINLMTHSWAPARSVITKYTYNGIDVLSDMDTRDKETEYVDSYTEDTYPPKEDEPAKELKYFLPFSSIGLHTGLIFRL